MTNLHNAEQTMNEKQRSMNSRIPDLHREAPRESHSLTHPELYNWTTTRTRRGRGRKERRKGGRGKYSLLIPPAAPRLVRTS